MPRVYYIFLDEHSSKKVRVNEITVCKLSVYSFNDRKVWI